MDKIFIKASVLCCALLLAISLPVSLQAQTANPFDVEHVKIGVAGNITSDYQQINASAALGLTD